MFLCCGWDSSILVVRFRPVFNWHVPLTNIVFLKAFSYVQAFS